MKRCVIVTTIVCWSLTAVAGKRERDLIEKELVPAVKDAETKFKSACGCSLAITIDGSTEDTMDHIRIARNAARDIADNAPKYCTDAASKKALCQMSKLVISKAVKAEFTFSSGNGRMTHDGQARATWDMLVRVLDK